MEDMRELITVETFGRALVMACVGWLLACLAVAVIGRAMGKRRVFVLGLACGCLSAVVLGLWKFYSWMVRVEPETGYVGLHKVHVFAINLLVFVAVGAALGMAFARLRAWQEGRGEREEQSAHRKPDRISQGGMTDGSEDVLR